MVNICWEKYNKIIESLDKRMTGVNVYFTYVYFVCDYHEDRFGGT